jgi:hypothetical protein
MENQKIRIKPKDIDRTRIIVKQMGRDEMGKCKKDEYKKERTRKSSITCVK